MGFNEMIEINGFSCTVRQFFSSEISISQSKKEKSLRSWAEPAQERPFFWNPLQGSTRVKQAKFKSKEEI